MQEISKYDFVVIGGGPNGLFFLKEFKKHFPGKNILLLEKKSVLNNLRQFPDVMWHSTMKELKLPNPLNCEIKDEYNATTSELIRYYESFRETINAEIRENSEVIKIEQVDDLNSIVVKTSDQEYTISCSYLILATGIFGNKRKLNLSNEVTSRFSYNFDCNTSNKNLVLVGGGNSAVDFITYLLPKNQVHWVLRSDTWTPPFSVVDIYFRDTMNKFSKNLKIYRNTEISDFDDRKVTLSSGEIIRDIDDVTVLIGYNSRNKLYLDSGFEFDGDCLKLSQNFETSFRGVYVFGALMARNINGVSEPTFIHNGNLEKFHLLVSDIKKREILKIMRPNSNYYKEKVPARRKTFFEKVKEKLSLEKIQ